MYSPREMDGSRLAEYEAIRSQIHKEPWEPTRSNNIAMCFERIHRKFPAYNHKKTERSEVIRNVKPV